MALILFLLFNGCGRKAPPRPPQEKQQPAVKDLSKSLDGDRLKLTWSVPGSANRRITGPAGFMIYKSRQKLTDSDCRNCPILFERIADIPAHQTASKHLDGKTVSYVDTVEKGYRYFYKVIVYSENGVMGKDSNTVELVY